MWGMGKRAQDGRKLKTAVVMGKAWRFLKGIYCVSGAGKVAAEPGRLSRAKKHYRSAEWKRNIAS